MGGQLRLLTGVRSASHFGRNLRAPHRIGRLVAWTECSSAKSGQRFHLACGSRGDTKRQLQDGM